MTVSFARVPALFAVDSHSDSSSIQQSYLHLSTESPRLSRLISQIAESTISTFPAPSRSQQGSLSGNLVAFANPPDLSMLVNRVSNIANFRMELQPPTLQLPSSALSSFPGFLAPRERRLSIQNLQEWQALYSLSERLQASSLARLGTDSAKSVEESVGSSVESVLLFGSQSPCDTYRNFSQESSVGFAKAQP